MPFRSSLRLALLAGAACISTSGHAQALSADDVAALRAEVSALKAQVDALEARLGEAETRNASVVTTAQAAAKKDGLEITFKGAPQISDGKGWSFKPRGRFLVDAASVNAPAGVHDKGLGFSNEVRRARLGVEGTMPGGFGYKFEAEFAGSSVELTDAFLNYKDHGLTVTIGQHNNFQSLEELSSSNDTSFMERAAFTDAFGFERRVGLSAQYHSGALLAQAGLFTDNAVDLYNDKNNSVSFDGRLVYAPKVSGAQLHFGASGHWRHLGDGIKSLKYSQRPLVHSLDVKFISTGNALTAAKAESSYGLEAAVISGRFHAAGEAYWQRVTRTGYANPTFFGGAIEAGYFLTNDSRGYKGGVFKGVKVKNPVGSGGIGAWQVNVRYDRLDLNGADVVGGTQDGYMASLIWTPIDHIRFMVNYAHLDYSNVIPALAAGTDRSYGVDTVGARAQVAF